MAPDNFTCGSMARIIIRVQRIKPHICFLIELLRLSDMFLSEHQSSELLVENYFPSINRLHLTRQTSLVLSLFRNIDFR